MSKAQARLAGCKKDASTRMDNIVDEHTCVMTKAMLEAKIKPYLKKGV
jgi:hypothetical protein